MVIGVDPHKLSATTEVLDGRERVLGGGRFGADRDGYQQMLTASRRCLIGSGRSKAPTA